MISRRCILAWPLALAATTTLAGEARSEDRALAGTLRIDRFDARLDDYLAIDAQPEMLADGFEWAEGPTWDAKRDCLYFSDIPANRIYRWDERRGLTIFKDPGGSGGAAEGVMPGTNGLLYDAANDRLLICDQDSRSIRALTLADDGARLLHAGDGLPFNSPNDLALAKDGTLFFTDPPYGLIDGGKGIANRRSINGIYRAGKEGAVDLLDGAVSYPNGIGLSPDERHLYVTVSDPADPRIVRIELRGRKVIERIDRWFDMRVFQRDGSPGMPDGMAVAADGTLFVAAPGGVAVIDVEGRALGRIVTGVPTGNCCIGSGGKWLYITANDRLWRVRLADLPQTVRHAT